MSAKDDQDNSRIVSTDTEQARLLFLSLSDEDRRELLRIMREKSDKARRERKK